MPRSTLSTVQAATKDGDVSRLSSPHDDLNQQIIRLLQDERISIGRAAEEAMT